jgi:hypothetical protein
LGRQHQQAEKRQNRGSGFLPFLATCTQVALLANHVSAYMRVPNSAALSTVFAWLPVAGITLSGAGLHKVSK